MSEAVRCPRVPEIWGALEDQIKAAIEFAKKNGDDVVELKFNDTSVYVAPGSTIPEVTANWYAIRDAKNNVGATETGVLSVNIDSSK